MFHVNFTMQTGLKQDQLQEFKKKKIYSNGQTLVSSSSGALGEIQKPLVYIHINYSVSCSPLSASAYSYVHGNGKANKGLLHLSLRTTLCRALLFP